MLLSHKTSIKLNENYSNIVGHMCYAAYKLWNVCNYERIHYTELGLDTYPDWYYQKKSHKDDLWYKSLPSQTAQEVCKLLDKSWKSFYRLMGTHGVENPHPPRFKHSKMPVTYMQNGIMHAVGSDTVRLSVSKQMKDYMLNTYSISETYIYLKNQIFKSTDDIKQIKIYPPVNGNCDIIVIYEIEDTIVLPDNGRYLSIDLGIHNLMTCYNSASGETFIIGRKYLSLCHYYNKEIARVQSQWSCIQSSKSVRYPKSSKHINRLHVKKNNAINDYLHKITRYIANYCRDNSINTIVIGDITNIREDKDYGHVTNQKLHSLPYKKIHIMLRYKLALYGISLIMQKEAYSSQTSPLMDTVCRQNANKNNRVERGLYIDGDYSWNADSVGAFNILRLYFQTQKINTRLDPISISSPEVAKVAA